MIARAFALLLAGLSLVGHDGARAETLATDPGASPNPLHAVAKDSLKAFLDAPLFDPSRRRSQDAPAPAVVAPPPSAEPPPTLHLLGIIHGARDMAIVRRDDEAKSTTLQTGDHVGSWRVTVLPNTGIRLSIGGRAFDYAIFTKGGAGTGPTGVAAPADSARSPEIGEPGAPKQPD